MDRKKLEAFAREAAKSIKTEKDLRDTPCTSVYSNSRNNVTQSITDSALISSWPR